MTNLASSQSVRQSGSGVQVLQVPIKSGSKLWQSAMVALLSASGYAVRGGTASTGPVVGVAKNDSAQPTSDGELNANLLTGVFTYPVHGTHTPTIADVAKLVYASDDNTISNDSADGPVAGVLVGFDDTSGYAMVFIHPLIAALVAYVDASIAALPP